MSRDTVVYHVCTIYRKRLEGYEMKIRVLFTEWLGGEFRKRLEKQKE